MAELPKNYDWKETEQRLQKQWERNPPSRFDPKSPLTVFSIDTPPPTQSGSMHLGHAFSYSQGDFIARYKHMRGFNLFYPFGTDDNGLPTERMIEKQKNVKATKMPRSEFIALCNQEIAAQKPAFVQDWKDLGIAADFGHAYSTLTPQSIKTAQASFLDLARKGMIYRQESPTMWCPNCQTAIAQAEIEDVEMQSHFSDVVFKSSGKDIVIATTRPELIPACVAMFFNPADARYKHLKGKFATTPLSNAEIPILEDPAVDPEKGTGIVMCCTFGDQMDIEWWRKFKLPLKAIVEKDGKLNAQAGSYAGMVLRDARKAILKDLEENGLLIRQQPITHPVKAHERCQTEVEFLKTRQWFIRVLDRKQELLDAGAKIKWYPEHMAIRYQHWVENLQWDWCISRQRPFGVPFPLWHCTKCDELVFADDSMLPVDPTAKKPNKPCKCGNEDLQPEHDVMDTWMTSSLTPQIALNWVDNYGEFIKRFPMSLRLQAHDIIRTWAFYTIVKAWYHHKQVPWHEIAISGHALDPKGKKMSKSKGNVIDPQKMLELHGADALRFWAASSKLGEDVPFLEKELVAGKRMMTKLWNAARFAAPHLEKYDGKPPKQPAPLDAWLLSKFQHLIKDCTAAFERYDYSRTKGDTEKFFWHTFCDNYLELVKDRLYNPSVYPPDTVQSAKFTLASALLNFLKLLAPIMPHISEELYQQLFVKYGGEKSIHRNSWPLADKKLMDAEAEKLGDAVVEVLTAVRKHKTENGLALNAPIEKLTITHPHDLAPVEMDLKAATGAKKLFLKTGEFAVEC